MKRTIRWSPSRNGKGPRTYLDPITWSPVSIQELLQIAGECCGGRCPVPLPDAVLSSHHHAHAQMLKAQADASVSKTSARANGFDRHAYGLSAAQYCSKS
jgi:hypothetical protein